MIVPSGQVGEKEFSEFARAICHRHFGVGSDGCIFIVSSGGDEAEVRIFNRDGSEAGMSGNGTRCACAYLHHQGLVEKSEVTIYTSSGSKVFTLLEEKGGAWTYRARMGKPEFDPASIPFQAPSDLTEIVDHPLEVGEETLRVTAVSVGNPQCVIFVEELPGDVNFQTWGKALEHHPSFPERTNVSFVKAEGIHRLRIRIWERGVGPTFSSGTGTCGAAAAALRTGRVKSPIEVDTGTGRQVVEWDPKGELFLTGEAVFVAEVKFQWITEPRP